MLYNLYTFSHEALGACFWTFLSLIVAAVMVVMAVGHWFNQRRRRKKFENR